MRPPTTACSTSPGVTFVASTGDYGAADPEYPAFSPNVVAVGGTSLTLNADNSYNSETGWGYYSNSAGAFIGSGGGISLYEPEPAYQQGVQSTGYRTTPDVSMVADPGHRRLDRRPVQPRSQRPVRGRGRHEPVGPGLGGPAGAGRPGSRRRRRTGPESSRPPRPSRPSTCLPQSDYNVIASGNNGYSAKLGLQPGDRAGDAYGQSARARLVAFQGPGTTYSGPTVAPFQSANLVYTGTTTAVPSTYLAFSIRSSCQRAVTEWFNTPILAATRQPAPTRVVRRQGVSGLEFLEGWSCARSRRKRVRVADSDRRRGCIPALGEADNPADHVDRGAFENDREPRDCIGITGHAFGSRTIHEPVRRSTQVRVGLPVVSDSVLDELAAIAVLHSEMKAGAWRVSALPSIRNSDPSTANGLMRSALGAEQPSGILGRVAIAALAVGFWGYRDRTRHGRKRQTRWPRLSTNSESS